ncbi:hypothetical protein LNP25_18200 [Klebsiella variicola subsp. variicola]|nr:hypothetical protein [Klebsiella variicola subsp. variicola]
MYGADAVEAASAALSGEARFSWPSGCRQRSASLPGSSVAAESV